MKKLIIVLQKLELELNNTKESSIEIREKKASSGATIEGLKKEEMIFWKEL